MAARVEPAATKATQASSSQRDHDLIILVDASTRNFDLRL